MRNTGEFRDPIKPRFGVGKEEGKKASQMVSLEMNKRDGIPRWGAEVGGWAEIWQSVRPWCLRMLPGFEQVAQKTEQENREDQPTESAGTRYHRSDTLWKE